jgi:hypothetical protein
VGRPFGSTRTRRCWNSSRRARCASSTSAPATGACSDLHLEFFAAIDEPLECENASDRLLDVHTQRRWLREIGLEDVDCHWKWRELTLLAAVRPGRHEGRSGDEA